MSSERGIVDRLYAYSDAVFAVIVTIMVLQLKPPNSAKLSALLPLWPMVVSYVVSYVFIAIIWMNHHYLTNLIDRPTVGLTWLNFGHLFFVSLLPFTTAWMAQTRMASIPVIVYAALFVVTDGAYNIFESRVLDQTDLVSAAAARVARRRSLIAFGLFVAAALLALIAPWAGVALICVALVLHLRPDVSTLLRSTRRGKSTLRTILRR